MRKKAYPHDAPIAPGPVINQLRDDVRDLVRTKYDHNGSGRSADDPRSSKRIYLAAQGSTGLEIPKGEREFQFSIGVLLASVAQDLMFPDFGVPEWSGDPTDKP